MHRVRRRSRRRMRSFNRKFKYVNLLYSIVGLAKVYLSPMTQKFVGCDIGDKVTPTNPWIFVDKEKIETNLEFYQNESCFYPIKDAIAAFPNDDILVGCYSCTPGKSAQYFVCTTINAQEKVLNILEKQRKSLLNFVSRMQAITPRLVWYSHGSEDEVQAEMNLNNRFLMVLEVHSIILMEHSHKFKMSFVEDRTTGYVEMLPGRNKYELVFRKLLHVGVQCAPSVKHIQVQTESLGTYTKSIQYCYEYPEIKLTKTLATSISKFLLTKYPTVAKYLDNNTFMQLGRDYDTLKRYSHLLRLHQPIDIKSYSDVNYCNCKKISCISWNPLVSGRIAAAYVATPLFYILKEKPEAIGGTTCSDDIILIWNYEDNHKPKLYLHCQNEVSAMSFCPYNENILVTGYTNGQISIWDLTSCFMDMKAQKYKSLLEQSNIDQLREYSNWFIRTITGNNVFPTISTSPSVSHLSPVTSISWFPPKSDEGIDIDHKYYLKFMTSGLDDNAILIWVVDPREILGSELEKYFDRKKTKPEALNRGISILKGLKKFFVPTQKLFLGSLVRPKNNPLLKVMQNEFYTYKAMNPETLKDLHAQTYFSLTGFESAFTKDSNVLFTGGLGESQIATCVGAEYLTDKMYQICTFKRMEIVHDGPILVCEANVFFRNIVLTVGGSVFAIWDCSKTDVALIWRKCNLRYLSGMWCFHRPLSILLLRSDRCFDYWNVCESSMAPIQTFKYTGYEPIMFYGDSNKFHVRKNTFIATDKIGSFKILFLPSETLDQDEFCLQEAEDFIRRSLKLMEIKELLQMKYKKIQDDWISVQESLQAKISDAKIVEMVQRKRVDMFQNQLEGHGLSVLLRLRQVDIGKLEQNKVKYKLTKCNKDEETANRQFKLEKIKEHIDIQHSINKIAEGFVRLSPMRSEFKVSLKPAQAKELKKKFLEDYKKIETEVKINLKAKKRVKSKDFKDKAMMNFMEKYSSLYRQGYTKLRRNRNKDGNLMVKDAPIVTFPSISEVFTDYNYI